MKKTLAKLHNHLCRSVLAALLLFFCLFAAKNAAAQDPAQYGTPFTGVPNPMDVNIYQVNIRPFSTAGNLAGVTARLSQIKALGINVVYILPVYPHGTDSRSSISPYCIKDFESVATEYGTLTDLRTLVSSAHNLGMAVIMDFVVNGTSWDHPWITQNPSWYVTSNGVIQQLASFPDVAALNFANTSMRTAIINAMRFWVFTANVDGFRCDFADNPPSDFWTQAITSLRGITTHKLLLLAEGSRGANFTSGFDFNFGFNFYDNALLPIHNSSSSVTATIPPINTADYTNATGYQQMARYTDNQDINGTSTALTVFGGTQGVMANFVVCAYMRSVPFLYDGQEVAFNTPIPWPWNTVKINWAPNASVTNEFTKVLAYRNSSTAIRRGTMTDYSDANICAFSKVSTTEKVVVLVNMRGGSNTYTIPFGLAGNYKDAYSGAATTLTSGAQITLTPFQYIVLTNVGAGTTYYNIINRWQSTTYLYDSGNGKVSYGTSPGTATSYQWAIVDAGGGYLILKNRSTGNLMNVQDQNGSIECNTTNYSLYSAMWSTPSPSSGWINIQNRWQTADLINIEALAGYAQYSGAQTSFYSAMWQFVNPVTVN